MRINFFEEYPTEGNMKKLDLVGWESTVLVAAPSLKEFKAIREKCAGEYPHITFGWWPTIPHSYWISGISDTADLHRLFSEITSDVHPVELSILLDLELPLKASLYFKNIFRIRENKKVITKFLQDAPNHNLKIYTAEYPAVCGLLYWFWQLLGLSPSFSLLHTKIKMSYSSMGIKYFGKKIWSMVTHFEGKFAQKNHGRVSFGLGTTAIGVLGNEPIPAPAQLKKDLTWANQRKVNEVFIFRLGGLDTAYLSVIKEFTA